MQVPAPTPEGMRYSSGVLSVNAGMRYSSFTAKRPMIKQEDRFICDLEYHNYSKKSDVRHNIMSYRGF